MREFRDIRPGDHVCVDCQIYEILVPPADLDDLDAIVVMRRIPVDRRRAPGLPIDVQLSKLERLAYAGRAVRMARPCEDEELVPPVAPRSPSPVPIDQVVPA